MRMDLAVVSWNEHVDRPYTSRSTLQQAHHSRRNLGKKAYKKKTYNFVHDIWQMLVSVLAGNHHIDGLNTTVDDGDHFDELSDNE